VLVKSLLRQAGKPEQAETWREVSEMKTRFLNMAAHELNTPLTPMRLQMHLIRAGAFGPLNERQANAFGILERNLERLHALVQEILDVARIEGGGLRTNPEIFAVDAAVQEAVESFRETAHRMHVEIIVPKPSGQFIEADRNRFLQILYNLLSNAIKFTPAPGKVFVAVEVQDGRVAVRVQDTGVGLTAEQLEQLFRPFSRQHESAVPAAGGTGLGLFISRSLAEAMGGTLKATSAGPGLGSTFELVVPQAGARIEAVRQVTPEEDAIARRLREII
jgi:signal transduction histidine kinase